MANPYVEVLVNDLLPVVAKLVTVVAGVLLTWASVKFTQKTGIDIDQSKKDQLKDAIDHGIGHAEEWASQKAKTGTPLPTGAEKMDEALKYIKAEIDKNGLEQKAEDELKKLINARLGLGVGA